jgi:hypothetical protein
MKKHLKSHPEVNNQILEAEKREAAEGNRSKKLKVGVTGERCLPQNVNITISQEVIIEGLVELCTVNGRPLSIVDDSGFKKIVSPIAEALRITINKPNVREFIIQAAEKIRMNLAKKLHGKIYYLKADSATRLHRSILGVNCQYYCPDIGRLRIATLAMTEVKTSSTADTIKNFILETQKKFNLSLKHCKGWTTDNGSNYVKTGKILDILQALGNEEEGVEYESIEYLDKKAFYDAMSKSIHKFMDRLKCWPHTMQLAVTTFLEDKCVSDSLDLADTIAKALRCPTMRKRIDEKNLKHAKLRNKTRWSSTFDQIKSIIDLKSVCKEFEDVVPDLKCSEENWNRLQDVLEILTPVRDLTVRLQGEQLVGGEAFAYLKSCLVLVEAIPNELSVVFYPILKKRADKLMSEPSILASVFFDPRYSCLLDETQRKIAMNYIINLDHYLTNELNYYNKASEGQENPTAIDASPDPMSSVIDNPANLDDVVNKLLNNSKESIVESPQEAFDLKISLMKFSRVQLPRQMDIFSYWEKLSINDEFRPLYHLATTCIALPVTQVSVERCFSTLKFILNDLRYNIEDKILEDILLVNLNKNLNEN